MMEANLFSKKLIKLLGAATLSLPPVIGLAQDRSDSLSLIDAIDKQRFKDVLNNNIAPNMPPTFRGAVDDLIDSTVAVIGANSNFGSGVLLTNDDAKDLGLIDKFGNGYYVATVDHVVSEAQDYAVVFYDPTGSELDEDAIERANIVGTEPEKDLAILKISNKPNGAKGSALVGSMDEASIGDDVQAVGHPNSMWWTYTRGYISQFRTGYEWFYDDNSPNMKADVVQTQTPITTGNSGGPLFTQKGEVLGLNAFGDPEFQSINFAISANELRSFAKSLSVSPKANAALTVASLIIPSSENWQFVNEFDLNEDGRIDAVVYDTDGDGIIDLGEFDIDYDGIADQYEFDLFKDDKFAMTYYPATSEFYPEWRIDSDDDGKYDLMAIDRNEDGIPDKIEAVAG